ncbi:hypothetical protein AVEN_248122-1 [Araneus ventricosus]|uniref:Uncharacterized protein n=1 Tax=Araneus ventricosus TaxID=182803 RepID=A0A4Y2SLG6_ARAVE|nr:hypothetical protein AVEN_72887-1 [Araneus ventricosus]GBN88160.1 hypothetical protein AVEN_148769-1 [Araneus ventricosus]GBN89077.1 hypothetical protein AVEN_248122-1 [Araneus ventricosus]
MVFISAIQQECAKDASFKMSIPTRHKRCIIQNVDPDSKQKMHHSQCRSRLDTKDASFKMSIPTRYKRCIIHNVDPDSTQKMHHSQCRSRLDTKDAHPKCRSRLDIKVQRVNVY